MASLHHVHHIRALPGPTCPLMASTSIPESALSPTLPMNRPVTHPFPKLRFVSNESGPYAKRRRINTACQTCRKRKTRCSGDRPVCASCSQHNYPCSYGDTEPSLPSPTNDTALDGGDGAVKPKVEEQSPSRISPLSSPLKRRAVDEPNRRPSVRQARISESPAPTSGDRQSHAAAASTPNGGRSFGAPSTPSHSTRPHRGSVDRPTLTLDNRNRMPFFRYFGPTAIMPGFKQMVVKVRKKASDATNASEAIGSPSTNISLNQNVLSQPAEPRGSVDAPLYDNSELAPSPLITHLCHTFFTHLGCNFPFLQEERFMRDLEEKQVDSILVDAVCAMAARFSTHPLLADLRRRTADEDPDVAEEPPSEYGQAFAHRAKAAITDTFGCPSVGVVQAALLLAYDEFGVNRDSGLWMYLGIAIRMAQDLGMQKLEGLKFEGRSGPTPKSVKAEDSPDSADQEYVERERIHSSEGPTDPSTVEEQKAVERERIDTLWAVFFLDRVISSGTGRPVTLRDRDIEVSFPSLDEVDPATGWPVPFPPLIRIIHLYGRVTDLLNGIKEVSHVTPEVTRRLAYMESQLTDIYQGLSPRLHFNAVNFQHYTKARQGTNFILLHIWFHTLIVMLHQPTLLHTFDGKIQELLPNSRELSMSSAKTIADILAFAELIDVKTGLGHPFTSQPIYIAACAFLRETALYSATSTPALAADSPPELKLRSDELFRMSASPQVNGDRSTPDDKQISKYTLLASAANQNYQRCYRALKSLETYWAGVKYILTVLEQKAKGVGDPELYTVEEMERAVERPRPEPSFTSPGWRRKLSWGTYLSAQSMNGVAAAACSPGHALHKLSTSNLSHAVRGPDNRNTPTSPIIDPSSAIGWSLTGTMNSPSTSLAVLYPTDKCDQSNRRQQQQQQHHEQHHQHNEQYRHPSQQQQHHLQEQQPQQMPPTSGGPGHAFHPGFDPSRMQYSPHSLNQMAMHHAGGPMMATSHPHPHHMQQQQQPSNYHTMSNDPSLVSDADLLLNLHSRFPSPSPSLGRDSSRGPHHHPDPRGGTPNQPPQQHPQHDFNGHPHHMGNVPPPPPGYGSHHPHGGPVHMGDHHGGPPHHGNGGNGGGQMSMFADMMIDSHDIDVSALSDDMMPWLEYLPHDMLLFDAGAAGGAGAGAAPPGAGAAAGGGGGGGGGVTGAGAGAGR